MSHYLHGESAAAFGERRPFPWRTFFTSAVGGLRACLRRRHERQELFDYMAIDHRAAADIGMTANDARDWAQRPFWHS